MTQSGWSNGNAIRPTAAVAPTRSIPTHAPLFRAPLPPGLPGSISSGPEPVEFFAAEKFGRKQLDYLVTLTKFSFQLCDPISIARRDFCC
jgi:hypothetical protein